MNQITAVLGVYNNVELTREFLTLFRKDHPDISLAIGALGVEKDMEDFLHTFQEQDKNVRIAYGYRPEDRICFSENFNAAVNLVETEYFVLVHNDMVIPENFFNQLQTQLAKVGKDFILYNTIEPLHCVGHIRPGKYLYDFKEETLTGIYHNQPLEDYVKKLEQKLHQGFVPGFGFFMAGPLHSFQDVGGFDHTRYKPCFCEDSDFNVRYRQKGYKMYCVPDCFVYHLSAKTSKSFKVKDRERKTIAEFVRKWGFEASMLDHESNWHSLDKPLKLSKWNIGYQIQDTNDIYIVQNIEPFIQYVRCSDKVLFNKIQDKLDDINKDSVENISGKLLPTLPDVDISVSRSMSEVDVRKLMDFFGNLPFVQQSLRTGIFTVGGFKVEIRNPRCSSFVEDNKNYLLEQKQFVYEQNR